ncbi:hypothetical protein ACFPTY_00490 [Halomonas beimenensis]|uniref:CopG family transcriptional regulator n=1 Tax=Halomonas beimenensis TaxID=475662 RepID=A0A291P3H7_9GAMM|nr:hypothetical protein [Halomonas beimenensis]ATJ81428.1 hypothetical protein BEI_0441 [Halomonas beimenensis]
MTHATGKKQSIRVFLDAADYGRYLVQAGTHHVTPSALGELLIQDGLERLERGDLHALGLGTDRPAAQGSGAN